MAFCSFVANVDARGNHSIALAGYEITYRPTGCGLYLDKPGFMVRGVDPSFQQIKRAVLDARRAWWADGCNGDENDRIAYAIKEVLDRQLEQEKQG